MAREQDETQRYLADFIALMRDAYTVGVITDRQKKFDSLQRLRKWSLDMSDSKVGRERQKNFLQYAQRQVRENFIRNFQTPGSSTTRRPTNAPSPIASSPISTWAT